MAAFIMTMLKKRPSGTRKAVIENPGAQKGVTLVEMALVLLIVGLLAKSALAPLAGFQAHVLHRQAEQQLQLVRESIFAHLVAYGALPCPLAATSGPIGFSLSVNSGNDSKCTTTDGFLPAATLRLAGAVNDDGALLDPWGRELRYAVSLADQTVADDSRLHAWTTPGDAARIGIQDLTAQLVLCNKPSGAGCSGQSIRADQIAFIVFSTGPDNSAAGLQSENLDNDVFFLVTEESIVPELYFDDLVVWGSAADVMFWMLRMGWLP